MMASLAVMVAAAVVPFGSFPTRPGSIGFVPFCNTLDTCLADTAHDSIRESMDAVSVGVSVAVGPMNKGERCDIPTNYNFFGRTSIARCQSTWEGLPFQTCQADES